MKKLNYLLLCLLTASMSLALIISSCSKEESPKEEPTPLANLAPFKLPENATVEVSGSRLDYTLPEGYKAYGVDEKANYISFQKGSVTCTCKSSDEGGCSPTTAGGKTGCLMTTCTNCELTRSTRTGGFDLELEEVVIFDMGAPNKRVTNVKDLEGKIMLPPQFAELDIIQAEIQKIEKEAARYASDRTKVAPVILYGYVVMLEVPEAYGLSTVSTPFYVCNCKEGSTGECKKVWYGSYIICQSTCKSCIMTATLRGEESNKE